MLCYVKIWMTVDSCINDWIIQWRRHRYHQWWQLISIWVTFLAIKAPVITRSFCEDLDDGWRTKDSWYGLMTELLHGGETYITGNDNSFLFGWHSLRLKHWLSQGVVRCLPRFFTVPLLRATTNTLETWYDECNMSFWWCCVPVVFFVNGHQKLLRRLL